jgi:phosphoserine aminotransferase
MKPDRKTKNNRFGCGPCSKRPGWSSEIFNEKFLGRSHRGIECKQLLKEVIDLQKEILKLPKNYQLAIVPGSDTGAIEMAMWNLLGERGVDVIVFDTFSKYWRDDIVNQLKIQDYHEFEAPFGEFPNITGIDSDRDIVFVLNGTTSGVCIDNFDFIKKERKGLTFCDATSGIFAFDIDFSKIDVLTYSWQKVLGGEAAHGILAMSPRALERLKNFSPNRPIPGLLNLKTKNGEPNMELYNGMTINTPSMLCVEDIKDALLWTKNIGGLDGLIKKSRENSGYLYNSIDNNKYLETLCKEKKYRSPTSISFTLKTEYFGNRNEEERKAFIKEMVKFLESEDVAYDINGYKDAPACFRVWCGPTIDLEDIKILCEWLNYVMEEKIC